MVDFEGIVTVFSKRLTLLAYSVTRDWYTAEDVVQEAFIKAYKKIDTIEDSGKIGSWLAAITTRTAIDFLRAEKRRKWIPADLSYMDYLESFTETGMNPEEEVEITFLKEDLYKSLNHLSKEYQEVLVLRVQYGLKEVEIAKVLHLKSTTVKTRLHRARKQLKLAITEKYSA
ncbi:RNA polymerase sigma-70 factor, ECF subfamily [Mesobacillus persicus]|uniref:RNA polymerase sigma factor n=1 Tax=Mesobacillus persicus TaxID=930146 RepID=A0A1H8ERF7_9BACI|nr:RNA polymerase sigma factor [Mesobacillus persicus]SEN22099.1 RNA polymerase sigma-70 factor, ECF subfamily [Mesobacillus persicus]